MEPPTPAQSKAPSHLNALNDAQRAAVEHGVPSGGSSGDGVGMGSDGTPADRAAACQPMLVIAGAGSGKTNTLAHGVAGPADAERLGRPRRAARVDVAARMRSMWSS